MKQLPRDLLIFLELLSKIHLKRKAPIDINKKKNVTEHYKDLKFYLILCLTYVVIILYVLNDMNDALYTLANDCLIESMHYRIDKY